MSSSMCVSLVVAIERAANAASLVRLVSNASSVLIQERDPGAVYYFYLCNSWWGELKENNSMVGGFATRWSDG